MQTKQPHSSLSDFRTARYELFRRAIVLFLSNGIYSYSLFFVLSDGEDSRGGIIIILQRKMKRSLECCN